jgi:flagellar hook-associated protein 3 FlgL
MRIPNSTASSATIDLLQKLGHQQSSLQNKIGTGQRIAMPSDDPAAVGRILSLEADRSLANQFARSAEYAREISQVSFDGLDQLREVSTRVTELATLGQSGFSVEQMSAYGKEVNQLVEHALQLGNSSFGGQYLFGGTEVSAEPFTATRDANGNITGVAYVGNAEAAAVKISESSSVTPRPDGTVNAGIAEFMNNLVALRDALTAGDNTAVSNLRASLETSEDLLVGSLSEQGSVQKRIEVNLTLQRSWSDNIDQMVGAEADLDIARAMVELSEASLAYEAALSSSSKILQLSILDYIR